MSTYWFSWNMDEGGYIPFFGAGVLRQHTTRRPVEMFIAFSIPLPWKIALTKWEDDRQIRGFAWLRLFCAVPLPSFQWPPYFRWSAFRDIRVIQEASNIDILHRNLDE